MISLPNVQKIQTLLVGHLAARTDWDEAPELFTIHQLDAGPALMRVPLSNEVWAVYGHPPTAVANLAAFALRLPRHPNGCHILVVEDAPLIGAAFRYEAYSISQDSDHPAAREAARRRTAGGSTPRFETIPGRIEQRCITAVDTDGGRYMASASRISDQGPDASEPNVTYLAFSDPRRDRLTGNVVDATNRFLNAVKPVQATKP
ncbi:hypothetical protein ACFWQ6_00860 [Streptomyces coelicoflavus]|uniref:hypothetical protein n=1 Tax=Streptomyces coelicoflavus TaxID=285562 RepID=UPI0036483E7B